MIRNKFSHKGDNGKVLVIGGSELYTGAPVLAGLAALRTGVDLVFVAAPERAANVAANNIDLITVPLNGTHLSERHLKQIKPYLEKVNSVVIGPGLGVEAGTKKAVLEIIRSCKKPIVVDADAIKALRKDFTVPEDRAVILTPHRGEFEGLSGTAPNKLNVAKFAKKCGAIIVLTAHEDLITNGTKSEVNSTGNPGMTVGGTGDVLSGVIAGLLAQRIVPFSATRYGTEINGRAGDLAKEDKGFGFVASDLLEKIPKVMRWVQSH